MKVLFISLLVASARGSLFGRDNGCNVMTPTNPDCCFMTNPDDPRAQNIPGALPLTKSPYIMNLVTANGKSLNTLDRATFEGKQIWTLTPLMDDPNDSSKQMPGGPVKVELTTTRECFDHFWVQGHKFLPETGESVLSGTFKEETKVAEFPFFISDSSDENKTIKNKVGCDQSLFTRKTEATVSSPSKECKRSVILSWYPPPRCTPEQIKSGMANSATCRLDEDIFFFLFTAGHTGNTRSTPPCIDKKCKFFVGQNTFGFYISNKVA